MKAISKALAIGMLALGSVVVPTGAAHALTATITEVNSGHLTGGILYLGNDVPGAPDNFLGYCVAPGAANNWPGYDFDTAGRLSVPGVAGFTKTLNCNGARQLLRGEVYPLVRNSTPGNCQDWDPITSSVGGAHFQVAPGGSIGTVTLPAAATGGIHPMGKIYSAGGISGNCRVHVDIFQDEGFRLGGQGAFGSYFAHHGTDVSTGWIFPGNYTVFIEDFTTGTKIRVYTSFDASSRFDVDLDASCFGFDLCQYLTGAPPVTGGGFHPLTPARILDTRSALGIANPVGAGDGSLPNEPNPFTRADAANNHQTKVTGFGGVPEHGVSAVLLNVTVDQPTADSWLAVYPKLPRRSIFEDQSWFRTEPGTSNLNFGRQQTLPNLVLARVGAGGKIMLENYAGEINAIADVVGWFDTGTGGDGFTGVTPERILDTRQPGAGGAFGPKETRSIAVINRANVPADATAVVLNVTQIDATAFGYLTVWPSGLPQPGTSNLNGAPGRTRPNLVVAKIGAGGKIDVFNFDGQSHVAVDVVGYFSPRGGKVFPVSPTRIMDSRSGFRTSSTPFGAAEIRNLVVTGIGGVPANATAVIANVTGTQSTYGSFLTVFPTGTKLPSTSNVNLELGAPAPNLVMMKIGAGGQISIYNDRGLAHVIVDVMGYVL
jgi:hypothetical protein